MAKNIYKIEDKIEAIRPLLEEIELDNDPRMEELQIRTSEIIGDINYSMRCSKEYNFFSLMLDKINILIDVQLENCMACSFRRNHFEVYVNPFLTFKFDKYMIRGFLIHEVYHIMNNHLARAKKYIKSEKYTHECLNFGMDAAINQHIDVLQNHPEFITLDTIAKLSKKDVSQIRPNEAMEYYIALISGSHINKPTPKEMLEAIQNALNGMKDKKKQQQSDGQDDGKEKQDNQNGNNNQGGGDSSMDDKNNNPSNGNGDGQGNQVVKEFGMGHDFRKMFQQLKDGDAEIQEHVLNELLKDVSSKCRGTIPAGIEDILAEINKEKIIRWQDVLKNYIGRLPIPFKKTSSRLDRRQPNRLDIMGKLPDAYYRIVCAIDTSGSMSDEDIAYCLNEVWNIVQLQKKRFEITVIECDAHINKVYFVKKKSDFQKIKVHGRGGTCFSPVYKYLRENKRKYKDAVVIYFTDGWGEYELEEKPLNQNNIWVLTGKEDDLSLKKWYGKRLQMNLDELRKKYRSA